jgi:L-amino acid N-acyltransferase YncA
MSLRFPIDAHLKDGSAVRLVQAELKDFEPLRCLYEVIVNEGTSFPHEQMLPEEDFQAYWLGGCATVLAHMPNQSGRPELAGAYYVKANWPGRASHVANAGFIVAPEWRRKGLGRLLGETMLDHARTLGFRSVIFNLVFAENDASWRLWEQLDFQVLGTVPQAARKNDGTYQDALIMFRSLADDGGRMEYP